MGLTAIHRLGFGSLDDLPHAIPGHSIGAFCPWVGQALLDPPTLVPSEE